MHENHSHQAPDHAHQVDLLARDATLLGDYLAESADWIASYAAAPATVLDLGAGTGVGAIALARRFPAARVTALDADTRMLDLAAGAAHDAGVGERVDTRLVDLDAPWPGDLRGLDLVWASGSLHHVADPGRLLDDLARSLAPQGWLAVLEMDAVPRYLPDTALAQRLAALITRRHPHSYPDWGPGLVAAGYDVVDLRCFTQQTAPFAPGVAAYARADLLRVRAALADDLATADLAVVDRLLDPSHPDSLERLAERGELVAHGSRTAWLARPTHQPTS